MCPVTIFKNDNETEGAQACFIDPDTGSKTCD